MKQSLVGLPLTELMEILKPLPSFRARQLFRHICQGAYSFAEMTDFSLSLRESMTGRFSLYSSKIVQQLEDRDGSVKLQIGLSDEAGIESVLLSDKTGRKTACLSTQAGCPIGCVFCKTGALGFRRSLSSAEIVEQFLYLRAAAGARIDNIVVMGMGEPLLNIMELRKALKFLTGAESLNFSKRNITISTCGITAGIRDLAENGPEVRLALSLTTADEDLRARLMPATAANPLPAVKDALLYYQQRQKRRITLEIVVLGGVNTRQEDVNMTADFARGLNIAVNLIPWNPVSCAVFEGAYLRQPSRAETDGFAENLRRRGLNVTVRLKRGRGIAGACGQLGHLPVKNQLKHEP
ncbi:MAG: 23S rRNA (adenine(2503)-C(2))-methyltransferase RlmN [Treponema sp.]|jgi:23S rRNA (adenine2503-C2)-methyltransferase|nr:23S rRNA (adenine(2503)-C(2))-methyltransferase RlmN [Treponema sp.]